MDSTLQQSEIVLRDLESLLRPKFGDELIVKSYTTKSLLPPGENYGSTILSVDAVIKRNSKAEEEDLHAIAKMSPATEFQKRMFDSAYTFKKEIFMYEDILPSYNKLELECGLKEEELFDVLPKLYGSRMSLDPNVRFDDDAVILLENLKTQGYYTGNRSKGYDMEHARVAISAMARFHAIGIAMKQKNPEYFEILKVQSKCIEIHMDEFNDSMTQFVKNIEEDEAIAEYSARCVKVLTERRVEEIWQGVPEEPWSTIVHSDFWVNNIMFHRAGNGRVDNVKFVDFQNYLFISPIREMVFFIFSSVDLGEDENNINELIDLYHKTLMSVLKRMDCDAEPYSREQFDAQLPGDAQLEFSHVCFMLKILTLNAKEIELDSHNMQNVIMNYQGNDMFYDRLHKFVRYFGKRNWI